MTILGFRKQELSTCRSIASIATPPEYRLIYTHMAALGAKRSGLNEESWVNKMTAMTIKVHERQYEDKQASSIIENVLLDSQIKHMNFK
ncbi:MAG: hypothetical protein Tp125DCM114561_18 [Prokaryotic dsDNA virus sp.]|nr:MAG: hypothetical protein Tp125DCM114561_18 [Prokaryotic dsDNA virus sp.]|tara:strand:+ start:3434 stop:3700 length:267 start_codon:yes stop_codon:yes gene_type:complete